MLFRHEAGPEQEIHSGFHVAPVGEEVGGIVRTALRCGKGAYTNLMARHTTSPIDLLLDYLDEAYSGKAWFGTPLRGTLRRVDAAMAAWRPAPGRKNIWEQMMHATYWKYTVRRRLLGEARGSFPIKGSNWIPRPDPNIAREDWDEAWAADLQLLDHVHETLRSAVASFPPSRLAEIPKGSRTSYAFLIRGIAGHDIYHAGQIQLLKKLAGASE